MIWKLPSLCDDLLIAGNSCQADSCHSQQSISLFLFLSLSFFSLMLSLLPSIRPPFFQTPDGLLQSDSSKSVQTGLHQKNRFHGFQSVVITRRQTHMLAILHPSLNSAHFQSIHREDIDSSTP